MWLCSNDSRQATIVGLYSSSPRSSCCSSWKCVLLLLSALLLQWVWYFSEFKIWNYKLMDTLHLLLRGLERFYGDSASTTCNTLSSILRHSSRKFCNDLDMDGSNGMSVWDIQIHQNLFFGLESSSWICFYHLSYWQRFLPSHQLNYHS